MTARDRASGSDLAKVDGHVITPEEYEKIPELTEEWFENAEVHVGGVNVPRGRPRSAHAKVPLKLRLDPEVVAAFRASGAGWQTRMNEVLRRAAGLDKPRIRRRTKPRRGLGAGIRSRKRA